LKGWLVSKIPTREQLLSRRWLRPFAHRLTHPLLWRFNRWSVSRGVALGLFAGLLLPFGQTPVAALLALSARANLIVAAAATFITNPITNAPIFYAAYKTGQALLKSEPAFTANRENSSLMNAVAWIANVSLPTAMGLLVFATAGAFLGYFGSQIAWRFWVTRRWRLRSVRRCTSSGPAAA
jgi:uncharacterized protein